MSYKLQHIYELPSKSFWNIIFQYEYKIEEFLKSHQHNSNKLEVDGDELNNGENYIDIHYASNDITLSIKINSSNNTWTTVIETHSNIQNITMLEHYQHLMNDLQKMVISDHKYREEQLEIEQQEACNIEYASNRI